MTVNGLRLHLAELGGRGRTIMLLHGVTSHWASWLPSAKLLAPLGRLVALDLRGHGDSQWSGEGAYQTNDLAADVEALVAGLDAQPIALVGSSWGGLVAIDVAARRPDLVRAIVSIDIPPSFTQGEHDVPPRPASFVNHAAVVSWERGRNPVPSDNVVETMAVFGTRPGPEGLLYPKHDPFFLARWPFRADDHWSQLPTVRQPTLIVRGAESPMLSTEVADRIVAALQMGVLITVPAAGHLVHIDAPRGFAKAIGSFLRTV